MNRIIRHAGHLYREVKTAALPRDFADRTFEALQDDYALAQEIDRPRWSDLRIDAEDDLAHSEDAPRPLAPGVAPGDPVEFMEQRGENYAKDLARQGLRPSTGGQQMDRDSFYAFENHFDREMTDEEHDAWFTGFNRAAQRLFKNRRK